MEVPVPVPVPVPVLVAVKKGEGLTANLVVVLRLLLPPFLCSPFRSLSLSLSLFLSLSVYSWELQPYWNNLTPNAPFWLNGWNSNFHLTELLFIPYLSLCLVAMTRRLKKKKRIREWIGETPVLGFKFLLRIHKRIEWNKMYLSKEKK